MSLLVIPLFVGCSRSPDETALPRSAAPNAPTAQPEPAPPPIADLPVELRVEQRTTTTVPGSEDALRLTIDDITRGRVMTTLLDRAGEPIHGPAAFAEGDASVFMMGDHHYHLHLAELDNAMLGDDFATFIISEASAIDDAASETETPGATALTETEKIEQLITHIESLDGVVFIRNGVEHDAAEAAAHLRRKWNAAGERITTAEEFIDHIASASSLTGRPYRIRLPNGREVPSGEYLHEQLMAIESGSR